jgi:hypothetical protein
MILKSSIEAKQACHSASYENFQADGMKSDIKDVVSGRWHLRCLDGLNDT